VGRPFALVHLDTVHLSVEHTRPMVTTFECCLREMHVVDLMNAVPVTDESAVNYLFKATGRFEVCACANVSKNLVIVTRAAQRTHGSFVSFVSGFVVD
jgi:hypothetical protein